MKKHHHEPTIFENRLSTTSVYFLTSDEKACCVGKVDVSRFCVEVNGSWVDQVLYRLHVLITGLDIHIEPSNDSRTSLAIEQEEIIFWLCI